MSNLTFSKVRTPNARLLYRGAFGFALDWNFHEAKIFQLVKSQSKIRLANNATMIYFFSFPDEEDFSVSASWVAREIIGIAPELSEDFQIYDIDGGEAYRFMIPITSVKDFLAESIASFHQECVEKLEQEKIRPANSWRLGFSSVYDEKSTKISAWIDFFDEMEEENCE